MSKNVHDLCATFYDEISAIPLNGPTHSLACQVLSVVESLRDAEYYPAHVKILAEEIREARGRTSKRELAMQPEESWD